MRCVCSAILLAHGLQIIGVCVFYGSFVWLPLAILPVAAAAAILRGQVWGKTAALVTSVLAVASWSIALRVIVRDSALHIDSALTALIWLAASIWCPLAVLRIFVRNEHMAH